jgi:3-hydroxy-9,10-secoandrosta-1,3,5(10)-triene-9,17-dione monooxygenase
MAGIEETTGTLYPVPEPDLTPEELIGRARAMRERLIEEAPLGEARGGYSEELHEEFTRAGFYRALQPRRYGGYEFGLDTFIKLITEISHGDAATGWSLCLATDHIWHIASWFSQRAQDELFAPDGHFCAPHRAAPTGTATPVDGGYHVQGTWDYCSGVTHSTHFIATAIGPNPHDSDAPPMPLACVIPSGEYTILDDWGGGQQLGLQGTGSNSVEVTGTFVPTHLVEPYEWKNFDMPREGTPGYRLHRNPLYLGRSTTIYYGGLGAPMVGAAKAALDEYEKIIRARPTLLPPKTMRYESADYQRWFGEAWVLMNSAEALLDASATQYMDAARRWEQGEPFTVADDSRIRGIAMHAGKIAFDAIDILFRTSGSSATRRGSRLGRCYRDGSVYKTHIGAQYDLHYVADAKVHFGLPAKI